METDFLFSPNGILLFRDFILLVESGKSKFWKITLFLLEKPFFFFYFQTILTLLTLFFRQVETYF